MINKNKLNKINTTRKISTNTRNPTHLLESMRLKIQTPPLPPMSSPRTGISNNQTTPTGVHLDLNQCTATPPPTGMMLALSPNTKRPQIMQQLRHSRIGSKVDTQHQFLSSSMALLSSNTLPPLHTEQIKTLLMTGMTNRFSSIHHCLKVCR